MPYFLLHVVSDVSIFFLQALELMLVDALLLANDHLKLTSHIEGPSRFWKVCVLKLFTIYVLELRHHKCYSSFFESCRTVLTQFILPVKLRVVIFATQKLLGNGLLSILSILN